MYNKIIVSNNFEDNISFIKKNDVNLNIDNLTITIPTDFSFDNINNLLYISKKQGRLEFIRFNKYKSDIELTQYIYTGKEYSKIKSPKLLLRHIEYCDNNNEFYHYFKNLNLNTKDFFKNKLHLKFLDDMNVISTHIILVESNDKLKFAHIIDTEEGYRNAIIDNLFNNGVLYQEVCKIPNKSLMQHGNFLLHNNKYVSYLDKNIIKVLTKKD